MKNIRFNDKIEVLQEKIRKLEEVYKKLSQEQVCFAYDGDFSENKDWETTREKRESLLSDIKKKRRRLDDLSKSSKKDNFIKVQQVTYVILKTNEINKVFLIDDKDDINPLKGRISGESPLGLQLWKTEEGKKAWVKISSNEGFEIEILKKEWVIENEW